MARIKAAWVEDAHPETYYKCDVCGAEQKISEINQVPTRDNPLGNRVPLRAPFHVRNERPEYQFVCAACDDAFTVAFNAIKLDIETLTKDRMIAALRELTNVDI